MSLLNSSRTSCRSRERAASAWPKGNSRLPACSLLLWPRALPPSLQSPCPRSRNCRTYRYIDPAVSSVAVIGIVDVDCNRGVVVLFISIFSFSMKVGLQNRSFSVFPSRSQNAVPDLRTRRGCLPHKPADLWAVDLRPFRGIAEHARLWPQLSPCSRLLTPLPGCLQRFPFAGDCYPYDMKGRCDLGPGADLVFRRFDLADFVQPQPGEGVHLPFESR